jgi:hypothetical protein
MPYRTFVCLHIQRASIGFAFKLQSKHDFDTRFNQLIQFKKEFGHARVPNDYKGHDNLGRWSKLTRYSINNNAPHVGFSCDDDFACIHCSIILMNSNFWSVLNVR